MKVRRALVAPLTGTLNLLAKAFDKSTAKKRATESKWREEELRQINKELDELKFPPHLRSPERTRDIEKENARYKRLRELDKDPEYRMVLARRIPLVDAKGPLYDRIRELKEDPKARKLRRIARKIRGD